jgi:hypothetical protein
MRVPLGILAIPLVIIVVFGVFISPDTLMRYVDQIPSLAPLKVRLASLAPLVVGNRSLGVIAIFALLLLILKQVGDYFDKS